MTLSEFIISYRETRGYSQRTFAQLCGLSNSSISLLEKNVNPKTNEPIIPNLNSLYKIAKAMGISIEELFASCDDIPINLDIPEVVPHPLTEREELVALVDSLPDEKVHSLLLLLKGL